MYIKELRIDGFGALSGECCEFRAPLTVVYGPNEAGKSTLLRFIRAMLYGFANRGQPAERSEPVRGGRHGGRLTLLADGREHVLERYADAASRRGGPWAVLRDGNGAESAIAQSELERRLLGGVSERLFRQLFSMSLDELHELRTLDGEEVGNYLYHAGMAGGAALTAATRTLESELDKLFKPKGVQPGLNRAMSRIRELEGELRRGRSGEGAFNEATLELEALGKELREAEARIPGLAAETAWLRDSLEAREHWLRAEAIRLEEAELVASLGAAKDAAAADPLPEDAAIRWEALVKDRERAREEHRRADAERTALHARLDGLELDESLLAKLPELDALEAGREANAARREELAQVESDRRLQDDLLASALARLSPRWTEAELGEFAALAGKEQARKLQTDIAGREKELERLEAELGRLGRQRAALEEAETAGGMDGDAELWRNEASGPSEDRRAEIGGGLGASLRRGGFVPRDRGTLLAAWHRLEDAVRQWEKAFLAAAYAEERAAAAGASGSVEAWSSAGASESSRRSGSVAGRSRSKGPARKRGLAPAAWCAAAAAGIGFAPPLLGARGGVLAACEAAAAGLLLAAFALGLAAVRAGARADTAASTAAADPRAVAAATEASAAAKQAAEALALAKRSAEAALRELLAEPGEAAAALLEERSEPAVRGRFEAAATSGVGAQASEEPRRAARADGLAGLARQRAMQARAETAEQVRRTLRDAVQAELDRLDERERARERRQDKERRLAEWKREHEHLERERRTIADELAGLRQRWRDWLAERGLPAGLSPELLPELYQLAEQALGTLRLRARLAERAAALRAGLDAYEASAAALLAACPPPAAAAGDALLAVPLLHREALRQREAAAEARRLKERLREAEAAEGAARAALRAAEQAALAPPLAAGDADEAAYERRLRVDARRRELGRERREARLRLAAGRGERDVAALEALLAGQGEAELRRQLAEARQKQREAELRRDELLDRRGRLTEQLDRLRREAETEDRVVALAELKGDFERQADRYAVLSAAAELIRRTKETFERERQPEVLRRASLYFEAMTNGAYARIVAPSGARSLAAETKDRRLIDVSFLSRGTREQLYLALRFALAGATSPERALPLLLDDLFVHFDAARLARSARVLGEVAKERQVVLFTCHEHTASAIADAVPDSGTVRLAGKAASDGAADPSP